MCKILEKQHFKKDSKKKQLLQDIRGELDKTVVRLDEMKTRVAGREDKLKVR